MNTISQIKAPIKEEIILFEKKFKTSLKSKVPLLDKIMYYIIKRKGKQMRPMFVFLSAKTFGNINEKTYRAASLIELLHTATLVHDDVIDQSNLRRHFFSINALWKNKIAVLVGDFLLSKGLLLSVENKDYDILEVVSQAVKEMSEGELLQIEKNRKFDIDEDVYFEIIRKKTAVLIAACCQTGAISMTKSKDQAERFRLFGENIGIAFQIKDDLLDYSSNNKIIGKPVGLDIRDKKMTLPLIYTINSVGIKTKNEIINTLKNHNNDSKKIRNILKIVKENGGVEYAKNKMNLYEKKSLKILDEFPINEASNSLRKLVDYVISRKK